MIQKAILETWVIEALSHLGGRGGVVDVSRFIWENHEAELRTGGDLFFTWQYDVRWAALQLRKLGAIEPHDVAKRVWVLTNLAKA